MSKKKKKKEEECVINKLIKGASLKVTSTTQKKPRRIRNIKHLDGTEKLTVR